MNNRRISIFTILAIVLALALGGIAIVTALRLSQQPSVSPTVPQVTPRAAAPSENPACKLSFTVTAPSGPICNSLLAVPNSPVITANSLTRSLLANVSGGFGNLTYTFSSTNVGGAGKGTFGQIATFTGKAAVGWAAPDLSNVTTPQTWTISVTVADSLGQKSAVGNCSLLFTYTPVQALKCDQITMVPPTTTVVNGSETRQLTATASGGTTPYTYSWVLTAPQVDKGTLSSTTGQVVTWTGPGTITPNESWNITATVRDSTGKTDSSGCVVNLTSNPPTQACNSSCNSALGCPQGLGCVNGQCRNVSCPNETSCSCQPETKVCNSACTDSSQCPSSMACANGFCRNVSCTDRTDCVCPTTTTTITPSGHRECRNNACVTVTGAGADTCTSDVTCRPVAVAPKIPESGVELPTILVIVGGAGLLLLGFLVVL